MAQKFSFDNAFLHFARTDGPGGFVWKYVLCYALATLVIAALSYVLLRPVFTIWFDVFMDAANGASEAEIEAILARRMTEILGRVIGSYILMLLLGIAFWAVFEAAIQRRYVREEGFSIGFGGDELRLLVVGLLWGIFFIVMYILTFLVAGLIAGFALSATQDQALFGILLFVSLFAAWFFWMWLAIRLAPASAMTIRDRKITFFDAWGATKGRFWTLFGSYIVLGIMLLILWFIVYMVLGMGMVAAMLPNLAQFERLEDDPAALLSAMLQLNILGPVLAGYVIVTMVQGFVLYLWAGPASLAAKTDPRGGGVAQAPDVFA